MRPALARLQRQLCAAVIAEKPDVPEAGRLLWSWFIALHRTRTYGFSANPISFAEIEAYGRTTGLAARPDHVAILRAMDDAWLAKVRAESPSTRGAASHLSTQEMNPAIFDAMFG